MNEVPEEPEISKRQENQSSGIKVEMQPVDQDKKPHMPITMQKPGQQGIFQFLQPQNQDSNLSFNVPEESKELKEDHLPKPDQKLDFHKLEEKKQKDENHVDFIFGQAKYDFNF